MDTDDFKQLCFGWTLAFVLVVGSILILGQFGPCGPGFPPSVRSRRSSRKAVTRSTVVPHLWTLAVVLVVGAGPPHPGLGQASRPAASGRRHCGKYSYSAVPEIREDRLGQIPDACCEAREEGARCAPGRPARDLRARWWGGSARPNRGGAGVPHHNI